LISRNSITPLRAFFDDGGVGDDLLLVGDRHGAARLRLGRAGLHLDQAHAAVAGDRQALVVAEARDLDAGQLAGLQDRDAGRAPRVPCRRS
jgi:hypothetical protein